MSEPNRNIISIIIKRLFFLALVLVCLFGLSKLFVHFSTGADLKDQILLDVSETSIHNPLIKWELSNSFHRPPDPYSLEKIQRDYLDAWYILNQSIASNNSNGLTDYFSDSLVQQIISSFEENAGYIHNQVDLNHELKLHLYSFDKQVIAFRDTNIKTIHNLTNLEGAITHQWEAIHNYEVVMSLIDGSWKIIAFKKIKSDSFKGIQLGQANPKAKVAIEDVKGINYYPKASPWLDFWTSFDQSIISNDFTKIKKLGFNTVRIFIPSDGVVQGLSFQDLIKNLILGMDLAKQSDLKVILCLFDFPGSFDLKYYPKTQAQLKEIVHAVKDHSALLMWDLKNEADRDFEAHGQDKVMQWLSFSHSIINELDSIHPITIGWSKAMYANLLADKIDIISFHDYSEPKILASNIQAIKRSNPTTPILLSEFGKSTYRGFFAPFGASAEKQQAYYNECYEILKKEKVGSIAWTLYDFEHIPSEVFGWKPWLKAKQKNFGIK